MNDKDEIRTTTTLWFTSIATHSSVQKALIQGFLFFGHSHPLPGLSCPLLQWAPSPTRRATPPPSTPPTPPWRTASRTSGCLLRWEIYPTVPFWNFRFWILLDCYDHFKPFERLWTVWTILGKTVHNLPKRYNIVPYLIFFTQAKFLENKIYTEKRQFFALNL